MIWCIKTYIIAYVKTMLSDDLVYGSLNFIDDIPVTLTIHPRICVICIARDVNRPVQKMKKTSQLQWCWLIDQRKISSHYLHVQVGLKG